MLHREFCICIALLIGSTASVYAAGLQTDRKGDAARNKSQLCALGTTYLEQRQAVCKELSDGRWVYRLPLIFDSGDVTPSGGSFSVLYHLASFLRHYPGINITLVGHSDSQGNEQVNRRLSLRRAELVRTKLVEEFAIKNTRIQVMGQGEAEPLVANQSGWGMQQNRRVEVYIDPLNPARQALVN